MRIATADEIGKWVVVAQAAPGQPAGYRAFGKIVQRFQGMAIGCSLGVLGDMLNWLRTWAQDAFLAAYKDLGRLQAPHAFPGWFKLIVLRKAYRLQRQRAVAPHLPVDDLHLATASPAQDDQLEQLESRRLVYRAIADLPEHGRLSTTLFYLTVYPQNQIAEMLDVPAATIRKRLQRARG